MSAILYKRIDSALSILEITEHKGARIYDARSLCTSLIKTSQGFATIAAPTQLAASI